MRLAGAQAGLSWETVLRKRENYRRAFHRFDPRRVARYTPRDTRRLLADPGIIRNRLKNMQAVGMVNDHTLDCFRSREKQSV